MRRNALMLCGSVVVLCACAGRAASSDSSDGALLTTAEAVAALEQCCGDSAIGVGLRIAADYKEPSITTREFTPAQFWQAVQPMAEYARFDVAEVGQSAQALPLRTITIGNGPTTVLVWSQMTGNESTGTLALADVVRWFANTRNEDRDVALRERLLSGLTVVLMPILNPDAAGAAGVLASSSDDTGALGQNFTPLTASAEQVLSAVRDRIKPDFVMGLLDRGGRTDASDTTMLAAIALAAHSGGAASRATGSNSGTNRVGNIGSGSGSDSDSDSDSDNSMHQRARLLAATLAKSFLTELPGRVVRNDDVFSLRTTDDTTQRSDVSTVFVTSGDLEADPQKQRLRSLHVAALLSALDALATGAYQGANVALYDQLSRESGRVNLARP